MTLAKTQAVATKLEDTLYKSHYGWRADTTFRIEGRKDVEITTMKRHSGQLVTSYQEGKFRPNDTGTGFTSFSHNHEDAGGQLCTSDARATEKAVRDQHRRAVDQFIDDNDIDVQ